jgi:hypothetical protein
VLFFKGLTFEIYPTSTRLYRHLPDLRKRGFSLAGYLPDLEEIYPTLKTAKVG